MNKQGGLKFSGEVEPTYMAQHIEPPRVKQISWHSKYLQWKMDHGLAYRGSRPPDWKPTPKGVVAKLLVLMGVGK